MITSSMASSLRVHQTWAPRVSRIVLSTFRQGGALAAAASTRTQGFALTTIFGISLLAATTVASSSEPTRSEGTISYQKKIPHTLFVWDFDWTVVNCNSDEYIPAQFIDDDILEADFRNLLQSGKDWHECVEAVVNRAIMEGATPEKILDASRQMPYLTGVRRALDDINNSRGAGQMILSDGNTLFIGAFLDANGLDEHFSHGIISNVGSWDVVDNSESGSKESRLRVMHQSKQYGGHDCIRCPVNLCKTQALRNTFVEWFKESNGTEDEDAATETRRPRIVYIGDGANDACPALEILREGDVLLARSGRRRSFVNVRAGPETDDEAITEKEGSVFGILPAINKAQDREPPLIPKCQIMQWHTGDELKCLVMKLLEEIQ